jgi:hypothetical protein
VGKGHRHLKHIQGDSSMGKSLDYTLGKGEKHTLKTAYSEYDTSEHEYKKHSSSNHHHEYKLPKLIFPNLMVNTLEFGEKNVKSTFICTMCLFMFGCLSLP